MGVGGGLMMMRGGLILFDERFFNDLNDCGVGKKVNFTEGGKGGVK